MRASPPPEILANGLPQRLRVAAFFLMRGPLLDGRARAQACVRAVQLRALDQRGAWQCDKPTAGREEVLGLIAVLVAGRQFLWAGRARGAQLLSHGESGGAAADGPCCATPNTGSARARVHPPSTLAAALAAASHKCGAHVLSPWD